jgi:cell division protease FtsH
MSHARDYSEEIASAIDDEVRRLIESAHDEAWDILVQYRDVLDNLVLQLLEHETLSRNQVLEIFSPVHKRPTRGSYTGYGKRLPSEKPPVLTPKELALTAATDGNLAQSLGNGQAPAAGLPAAPPPPSPPAGNFGNPLGGGSPLGGNPLGGNPLGGGSPLGGNPLGGGQPGQDRTGEDSSGDGDRR